MAATLPEDYRPSNFYDEDHGGFVNEMQAYMTLSSFAMIGVGGFIRAGFVSGGTIPVVAGTRWAGLTLAEATQVEAALTAAEAGDMSLMTAEVGTLITTSGLAGTTSSFTLLSLEGLIALAVYTPPPNYVIDYGNYGNYMGGFTPGGGFGGSSGPPPGFPGFPGGGHIYGRVCYILDGQEYCHLQY